MCQADTVCQRYSQLLDCDVLQIAKYSKSGPITKITAVSIEYIKNISWRNSFSYSSVLFFALPSLPTEFLYLFALNGYNKKATFKADRMFHLPFPHPFAVCECEGMDFFLHFFWRDQFYSIETLSKKNISAFVSSRIIQMGSAALFL